MSRGKTGRSGYEEVTGDTPDISEWLDFEFYDLVWWWDRPNKPSINDTSKRLARWLGVSHRVGSDLCYWLVTESGQLISKTSVEHVTRDDYLQEDTKVMIERFDEKLEERLDDTNFTLEGEGGVDLKMLEDIVDNDGIGAMAEEGITPTEEEYDDMLVEERPDIEDDEVIDKYLNMELTMGVGTDDERRGRVVKRSKGIGGEPIGRAHANPYFDTREYDIEFTDGTTERYSANVIADNMYAQVDDEGNMFQLLDEITNHKKDGTAVDISDGMITSKNGNVKPRITTQGWWLLVLWKDQSTSWVKLKDLKASNPVELAEYAVANRLTEEPAFKWWVPETLRKRNRIISKVKKKYWRTTHKFGIKLPHSVEEALEIDRITGTDLWRKALNKEMSKVKMPGNARDDLTLEDVRSGKAKDMIGYQEIGCHIVFDIKMDFSRKARFVAGGHTTDAPASMTYSSVVSRESVRLGFMIAALNGLDVMACDLERRLLKCQVQREDLFRRWYRMWSRQGKGMRCRSCLVRFESLPERLGVRHWHRRYVILVLLSTTADPDVWIRAAVRGDGFEYYEMVLVYVDDCLAIGENPRMMIDSIGEFYKVKPGSDKEPEIYLGANVEKVQMPDGREVWATSPRDYVKNAIKTVEGLFDEDGEGYVLKNKVKNPFPHELQA